MAHASHSRPKLSALEKALRVIEVLADEPQPVRLADITDRVPLPRATTHRVLKQLEAYGLIVRNHGRDRFSVGPTCAQLALKVVSSANQAAPLRAVLQDVVRDTGETCNLGVLDGFDLIYLQRIECQWPLRVHMQPGSRLPAYCTSGGKVLLAHLDPEVRTRLLRAHKLTRFTRKTITRVAALEAELDRIRSQGYGVNDNEYTDGIVGIAVPVRAGAGRVLAALALHGPTARFSIEVAKAQLDTLHRAAERIAHAWGLDSRRGQSLHFESATRSLPRSD